MLSTPLALAERYQIDPAHSFVEFRILHLGFSVLVGRFNTVEGRFDYDPTDPGSSTISVEVDTASVDTNHAKRDKHLRSEDFLDVKRHPKAVFKGAGLVADGDVWRLEGELSLHGVMRPITLEIEPVGAGEDPWGGYRSGFVGRTKLRRSDFGMTYDLGPKSDEMELELFVEGIREP